MNNVKQIISIDNMDVKKYLFIQCFQLSIFQSINGIEIIAGKSYLKQECSELLDCVRCNSNGCFKCSKYIMNDTRECVDRCPIRYISQWSSTSDVMGRICVPKSFDSSLQRTLLIGIICGALLCFILISMVLIVFKRKKHKRIRKYMKDQLISDEYDRHEFIKQLDELKPYAEYFLMILNDTRREIRKSHIMGDIAAAAKLYPVLQDLAKILILCNRPVEMFDCTPPQDWSRLLQWADRILANFKPQQQINQLIEFLQKSESPTSHNHDDIRLIRAPTTFKSLFYSTPVIQNRKKIISPTPNLNNKIGQQYNNNNNQNLISESDIINSKHQFKESSEIKSVSNGSLISLQDLHGEHKFNEFGSMNFQKNIPNCLDENLEYNPCVSKGSLLVVEDELIELKLGLRPQDEIITEL